MTKNTLLLLLILVVLLGNLMQAPKSASSETTASVQVEVRSEDGGDVWWDCFLLAATPNADQEPLYVYIEFSNEWVGYVCFTSQVGHIMPMPEVGHGVEMARVTSSSPTAP